MLPTAILLTFFYTKLSNRFNREKVFYVIMGAFLAFFAIFILVLYPYRESLYLNGFSDQLAKILPAGFKGFIAMIRYWMYSLFYVMAESWSNIMLSVLLWGFANDVTTISEAKRFYALFGIGINSSGIIAGKFGDYLSSKISFTQSLHIPKFFTSLGAKTAWDETLYIVVFVIIACGMLTIALHRFLHIKIFIYRDKATATTFSDSKDDKPKLSLRKTLAYVARSKYLMLIAVIVLAYNLMINLTEVLWKAEIKELFPRSDEYLAYMSKVTFFTGIVATFGSYFISGNVIRRFGWKWAALITPVIMLITGAGFFYFLFVEHYSLSSTQALIIGSTPLAMAVFFGALQNALSRAAKYTVYDDTKEMAFIPLSAESRLKGKSAIDGIGSRLGKSGSSLIFQMLLLIFSTPLACSAVVAVIALIILPVWFFAVRSLDKRFQVLATNSGQLPEPTQTTSEIPAS